MLILQIVIDYADFVRRSATQIQSNTAVPLTAYPFRELDASCMRGSGEYANTCINQEVYEFSIVDRSMMPQTGGYLGNLYALCSNDSNKLYH